ncbi:MAG: alpha-amylase family glycosyl hydrolase [Caldilineaceae bacterium]
MSIHTPDWVKNAVFYQIFPDRFARGKDTKPLPGVTFKVWGTPPEEDGFQGGDLRGIVDKLGYLKDLGITALYLNPIFASASNHRYHTYDYMQVDPLLGGDAAFRYLLDAAHDHDIRVVIDGVFNHASRGFWAFHHILETGGNSPYIDWFIVQDWPLRPYQHDEDNPHNYDAWWGLPALPKFNIQNPGVREYLLDVSRHWIEFGADGWRLDVPEEIKDPAFWRQFRTVVKQANPEAYITGEIWRRRSLAQGRYVRFGDELHFQPRCTGLLRRRDAAHRLQARWVSTEKAEHGTVRQEYR